MQVSVVSPVEVGGKVQESIFFKDQICLLEKSEVKQSADETASTSSKRAADGSTVRFG